MWPNKSPDPKYDPNMSPAFLDDPEMKAFHQQMHMDALEQDEKFMAHVYVANNNIPTTAIPSV